MDFRGTFCALIARVDSWESAGFFGASVQIDRVDGRHRPDHLRRLHP
jgi:hypothetical protein